MTISNLTGYEFWMWIIILSPLNLFIVWPLLIPCFHVWAVFFFEARAFSVNMYLLIISVGIFSVNIFTSSGPLEIFKRYFRKSYFFIKDSHLSDHLSIYGNMVELFRIIGLYVWTALYWYDPLIYSYVSTYDICIILYYWMWLVVWSLFIHVNLL